MTDKINRRNRSPLIPVLLYASDLALIFIASFVTAYIEHIPYSDPACRMFFVLVSVAYLAACLAIKIPSNKTGVTLDRQFIYSCKTIVVHALVLMSLAAFLQLDFSPSFYLLFYGLLFVTFPVVNLLCGLVVKKIRKHGYNQTRVAIVGTSEAAKRLADTLLSDSGFGYKIVGYFDNERLPDFDRNYLGDLNELEKYASRKDIDEIYFTLVGEKAENMPRTVKIANDNVIKFYYVPKISRYVRGNFQLHKINMIPLLTLMKNPLSIPVNRFSKRLFDITFSSIFLIFSPIIFIPIAIGIKMSSPGPVFFRQERTGYKGKTFRCFKFRTMKVNASADTAQATSDDPRKTAFGSFLRRTNIDELPQFINVWLGDMSVVGPRPHMLKHTEDYTKLVDKYMVRHVVKPGITGWAQVHGYRGLTDQLWKMEKRVEHDVWYIENWTFSLDLKIVVRTIINTIKGDKNAF